MIDPLVWSAGAFPKRRRLVHAVRDLAMVPGPPAIWTSGWFNVSVSASGAQDVADWPYSVSILVKWLPSWVLCTGLLVVLILGLVVFLMLKC